MKMIEDKDIDYFIKKLKNINIKSNERWAIYGTGNGAELIFKALSKMSINNIYNIMLYGRNRCIISIMFLELYVL